MEDLPVLAFESPVAWKTWLDGNHARSSGIWMKIAKASGDARSLTYAEAIEVALCYGWIDGQKGRFDDAWWLQRFTPRGPRSIWSRINREKAEALVKTGMMKPSGLAAIEMAKRDGRWDAAYEGQKTAQVPPDLKRALAKDAPASAFFAKLSSVNRYAILFRLHNAKKAETRKRRLEQFMDMLRKGQTIHPQTEVNPTESTPAATSGKGSSRQTRAGASKDTGGSARSRHPASPSAPGKAASRPPRDFGGAAARRARR
jgi:uncharacterized protein YdeI (YjbR/CyaY-like superfamily)